MGHMIYVVDDKEVMRDSAMETLELAGYQVRGFPDVSSVKQAIQEVCPDLVLTDLSMPGEDGIDLVAHCRRTDPNLPVVLMTAYASVDTAVMAMKEGAYDYLTKPFEVDELEIVVKRALETRSLKKENAKLKEVIESANGSSMVGSSRAMQIIRKELALVARASSNVLILGESGTGKEVTAREIHRLSEQSSKPFLAVNCAALSAGLLESELFGHEKGSFTGAHEQRKGRFELANGGTLLLDEITEMDIGLQSKLLRVLQERVIERVGSSKPIEVDVRVIATSNRNMVEAVKEGHLRQDLYYRLNVVTIELPPLRDRTEDLLELVDFFKNQHGSSDLKISESVFERMKSYVWPGNIRELSNLVERACVLGDVEALVPKSEGLLPPEVGEISGQFEDLTLEEIEKMTIRRTLDKFEGRRNLTAQHLGIAERTLRDKIKKWQL